MKSIKDFLQAILIFISYLFIKILGLRLSGLIGYLIGRFILCNFNTKKAEIIQTIALSSNNIDSSETLKIYKKSYGNYIRVFCELCHMKKLLKRIEIIDRYQLLESSNQLLFVTAHIGNWELIPYIAKDYFGDIYVTGISSFTHPYLNKWLSNIRIRFRARYLKYTNKNKRIILKKFKNKESSRVLISFADHNTNDRFTQVFLSQYIQLPTVVAEVSVTYGLPVIPLNIVRKPFSKFQLVLGKPIYSSSVEYTTYLIHKKLNNWLTTNVSNFYWDNKRFN